MQKRRTVLNHRSSRLPESADHCGWEDYKSNNGRLLGYVQADKEAGTATVALTAAGLEPATVELDVRGE